MGTWMPKESKGGERAIPVACFDPSVPTNRQADIIRLNYALRLRVSDDQLLVLIEYPYH